MQRKDIETITYCFPPVFFVPPPALSASLSTLKRLSVTRMNFYMRYLQPKSRRATQRERKATKTLAIVLGQF